MPRYLDETHITYVRALFSGELRTLLNFDTRRNLNINRRSLHGKSAKNLLLVSSVVVVVPQFPIRVRHSGLLMLLKINVPVTIPAR